MAGRTAIGTYKLEEAGMDMPVGIGKVIAETVSGEEAIRVIGGIFWITLTAALIEERKMLRLEERLALVQGLLSSDGM